MSWIRSATPIRRVTLAIYAHVLRRRGDTGARLDALVRAADWAAIGSERPISAPDPGAEGAADPEEIPH
jgi:hypothetical protein